VCADASSLLWMSGAVAVLIAASQVDRKPTPCNPHPHHDHNFDYVIIGSGTTA
jgi:hypothetical protein